MINKHAIYVFLDIDMMKMQKNVKHAILLDVLIALHLLIFAMFVVQITQF